MTSTACRLAGGGCLFLLLSVLLPESTMALEKDSASAYRATIIGRASKGHNFDSWGSEITVDEYPYFGGYASLNERLDVILHRLPEYLPQWKVDHALGFQYDRPVSVWEKWKIRLSHQEYRDQTARRHTRTTDSWSTVLPFEGSYFNRDLQSDNLSNNNIRTASLQAGGSLITDNGIELEGLVGPVFDSRGGINQSGAKYDFGFGFSTDSSQWQGNGWYSHFRAGDSYQMNINTSSEFGLSEAAIDHFSGSYMSLSRLAVNQVGNDFGRRDDQRVELSNDLTVNIAEDLTIKWDSRAANRTAVNKYLGSERRDREFDWTNSLLTIWQRSEGFAIIEGGIDIQQQEYAGGLTQGHNNKFSISTGRATSPWDSTFGEASVSLYRFDTPDQLDFNDRDELRWRFALKSSHRLTPSLGFIAGAQTDLNHLVYIHKTRSAENRWTRQFSLYSEIPWQEKSFENISRFAVSAHYTDYDFSPYDLTNSRLYRTFTAIDTIRFSARNRWGIELSGYYQLDDHGELDWGQWLENVSERGRSYTLTTLPFRKFNRSEVHAGWTVQRRNSTILQDGGEEIAGQDIRSSGPVARINLKPNAHLRIEFLASVLTIKQSNKVKETIPDVNFILTWLL